MSGRARVIIRLVSGTILVRFTDQDSAYREGEWYVGAMQRGTPGVLQVLDVDLRKLTIVPYSAILSLDFAKQAKSG